MGLRVRLKASYDISGFEPMVQTFLRAFKKHGLILADNGGQLEHVLLPERGQPELARRDQRPEEVPVSAFEAVDALD